MPNMTISTETIRGKLIRISQYMPGLNNDYLRTVYDEFGRQLVHRLTAPEIDPTAFLRQTLLLIHDLEKGVDGYTGKPMDSSLAGHSPNTYSFLRTHIPKIAEVTTPQEFAQEVRNSYAHVQAKLKGKQ